MSHLGNSLFNWLLNPRKLLLTDAVGGATTAFATFFLLAGERIKTGMPVELLYAMAMAATSFVCFDVVALLRHIKPAIALRTIACANLTYCILVAVALYVHRSSVTSLGLAYFCIEIPLVATLAVWELKVSASRASS